MPSPPGTSMLPVTARSSAMAWEPVVDARPIWSQVQPHWMQPGRFMAYIAAALRMRSGSSQVISDAHSGVYGAMCSISSS